MRFRGYLIEARELPFFTDCVSWPRNRMSALEYLIDNGKEIKRREYVRSVSQMEREEIENHLGYSTAFRIEKDYAVSYYKLPGFDLYYMVQSAIEYVFATSQTIEKVFKKAESEL